MLLGNFKEARQEEIEITEFRPDVFLNILQYIYGDELDKINPENAVELMMIATEFGLLRLKEICEDLIQNGVDNENAAWLFEISDHYQADQLKAYVMYYIIHNYDAVSKSKTFSEITDASRNQINSRRGLAKEKPKSERTGKTEIANKNEKEDGCVIQ